MTGQGLAARVGSVIVFGGSFDPVHKAHVTLPLLAQRECIRQEPDAEHWLLYVPARQSPHKATGPRIDTAHRLRMLELATEHLPRVGIWTDELDRSDGSVPSYTIDTLRRLRHWLDTHAGEDVRLRLLLGADQARTFHTWREPHEIVRLARPLVMLRGHDADADTLVAHMAAAASWSGDELHRWRNGVVTTGLHDISSTAVRTSLAAGDYAALARMLDPKVLAYIREHGLYTSR